jgi:DNA-binding PadR family transcriptional regulator
MARQAQTSTAVLGALFIEPMTGYEIRQAISTILGHFWHESFGQIYPCLADLEASGDVRSTPGDRPGSTRYEITPAGRSRLQDLLREPAVPQPPRNGTLLRVFFGRALPPGDLDALLAADEEAAQARLAGYAAIRAGIADEADHAEHSPFWLATLRAGELSTEAHLTWLRETRAALIPPATLSPS